MAGIDLGGGNARAVNQDINMIPFIDLLMVTIAFLLITAVWVTHSRIEADAQVPSDRGEVVPEELAVHVYAERDRFRLVWRVGSTVVDEAEAPRTPGAVAQRNLSDALAAGWKKHGRHVDPADRAQDRAVLHTADGEPFKELVAMMDAIAAPTREAAVAGRAGRVSAFRLALAR